MNKLFSDFKLKNINSKNRIVMAPMCMYSSDDTGVAKEWHLVHYLTRSIGQVGIIIMEATAVEPKGRISPNDLGLWNDEQMVMLKKIVESAHANKTMIGIQLNHAGRKSGSNNGLIAPSSIPYSENSEIPQMMSQSDIKNVITLFKEASQRALKCGFDFIEIHGAHGYLINQFLSPLSNTRNDEYGGNNINRAKFLKEIVSEIRTVWPKDKALFLRVTAEDYHVSGNHPSDLIEIINQVKDDIDVVDVSSGGVINVAPKVFPGYQLEFAKQIKEGTGLPVIGGGIINTPKMANDAIKEQIDLIFIGRELLRNPYYPLNAARELGIEVDWPFQYKRGKI